MFDPAARNKWIMDKVNLAVEQHMDGINLDIEFPVNKTSAPILTQFVQETNKAFKNSMPYSQVGIQCGSAVLKLSVCVRL